MKRFKLLSIALLFMFLAGCNEQEWLKEVPLDFYSPENSYKTYNQFKSAVARLYESTNNIVMWSDFNGNSMYHYCSDIAYNSIDPTNNMSSYTDKLKPESGDPLYFWQGYYRIVFDANVIIGRIDNKETEISDAKIKNQLKAEAMFFRAFMYRNLGIHFGGVPLILEEISEPRRNFVRAPIEDIWKQCISDLDFATINLPEVTELKEDGRLTKAAAYQLLTEIYIITKNYDAAITAASKIISNTNYSLMTKRFGKDKDKTGDVYWDLFRRENQNRKSGNTESIWVAQYEYNKEGGGGGSLLTRNLVPLYWYLKGSDGQNMFIGPSSKYGGRGIGFMSATDYLLKDVWKIDTTDIRNSKNNIIRDIRVDNPKSKYYGQLIVASGAIKDYPDPWKRSWTAIFAKSAPLNDFPIETIIDPVTGATNTGANKTFRDHAYMRLAETFLLRAEAYLGKGDKTNAANDINTVRARANAKQITSSIVDIDFILDERARELNFEELRIYTLMRLNKLAERVKKYDPMYNGVMANNGVEAYHNLWPIPQSEIERNTEAVLAQNPGYK